MVRRGVLVTVAAMLVALVALAPPGVASRGATPAGMASQGVPGKGPIVTLSKHGRSAAAVIDKAGNATVAWATGDFTGHVLARTRPAGGAWSAPTVLAEGSHPLIGVDDSGTVTVVFQTNRKGYTTGLAAVRRTPGQAWTSATRLTHDIKAPGYVPGGEETYGAIDTDVAVGVAGDVVVVWAWGSQDRIVHRIEVARRPHGGSWTSPLALGPRDGSTQPKVGVDAEGRTTVVWETMGTLLSRRFVPGSGWTAPITLFTDAGFSPFDVAVTPSGDTTAVAVEESRGLTTRQHTATGSWGPLELLAPAEWVDIAVDGPQSVAVAWLVGSDRFTVVRWQHGRGWSRGARISHFGIFPDLDANMTGDLVLSWQTMQTAVQGLVRVGGHWSPIGGMWPRSGDRYYEAIVNTPYPDGSVLSVVSFDNLVLARRLTF